MDELVSIVDVFKTRLPSFERNSFLEGMEERKKDLRRISKKIISGGPLDGSERNTLKRRVNFLRSFSHVPGYPAEEMSLIEKNLENLGISFKEEVEISIPTDYTKYQGLIVCSL